MQFTVRPYSNAGVPVNPEGDDEALPTVEADSAIAAARIVTGLQLSDVPRPAMYRRAEVWPYGKPRQKVFLFEPANSVGA